MKATAKAVACFAAAIAGCYLGLLAVSLVWRIPALLVLIQPGTQIAWVRMRGLVPDFSVSGMNDPSLMPFVFQDTAGLLLALGVVAAGPLLGGKLHRWGRLLLAFTVLWAGLVLMDSAVGFAQGLRGPLTMMLRLAALADFGEPVFGMLLAATVIVLVIGALSSIVALLHTEDCTGPAARAGCGLLLFVAPVAAINWLQGGAPFGFGFSRLELNYAPTLLAALALLAALSRPRPAIAPLQLGGLGAAAVLCVAASVYAGTYYFSRIEPAPQAEAHFDEYRSSHWDLRFECGTFTPEHRAEWGRVADERLEDLAAKLGYSLEAPRRVAYIHVTTGSKRAVAPERRTDSPYLIDSATGALHHLLAIDRSLDDPRGEALLLLREAWGEPGSANMAEAIARYLTGQYLGHDLAAYARRITCEEQPYTLAEILALDEEYLSPLVRDALAGGWIASRDPDSARLKAIYSAPLSAGDEKAFAQALNSAWPRLETAWKEHIDGQPCPDPRAAGPAPTHGGHKGITFTHEFMNGWGYGSDMAGEQLRRIRALGATAIALIPYAGTGTPPETTIRFRMSESDERVVRSIQQAHHAGLQVMLKPQVWGRLFTGDMRFERIEDFEVWFGRYRRWMLHNARLAELHGIELFCIGNELNGMTVHEQHWRRLIGDVRRIYSGPLTFAANWDEEFERITFWDELDYLGVNFYFPLAERGERPRPGSRRLRELTARLEAMHRRYGKPLLFTEVGYPPLATAAAEPWKETNAAFDEQLQEQCYRTVFEAFSDKPWFAGMYWWKWPSHGQGSAFSPSHNPIGKPALDVLRSWYGKP